MSLRLHSQDLGPEVRPRIPYCWTFLGLWAGLQKYSDITVLDSGRLFVLDRDKGQDALHLHHILTSSLRGGENHPIEQKDRPGPVR